MNRPTLSICTPWHNHPEFLKEYREAVRGAGEVIIMDNASYPRFPMLPLSGLPESRIHIERSASNLPYGVSCNCLMREAKGDILICLNNDIRACGDWLSLVEQDVTPDTLCGPSLGCQYVGGVRIPYIEGWCIAARRETWEILGGFDTTAFLGNYWEDTDLSFRAILAGMTLKRTEWPLQHLGNGTSRDDTQRRDRESARNRAVFEARVRKYLSEGASLAKD